MKILLARLISVSKIPALILIMILFAIHFYKSKESVLLPDYGAAPSFQFTDASGKDFNSSQLLGKPWIASFIFTRCPDQCPRMVKKLKKISKRLPEMQFVSFSVDPEFDKPEILADYIRRGQGPEKWILLTGEKSKIKETAASMMIAVPDNPELHGTRFLLIDGKGRIRGFYDSQNSQQMTALAVDARAL